MLAAVMALRRPEVPGVWWGYALTDGYAQETGRELLVTRSMSPDRLSAIGDGGWDCTA
jgi:hypothetical protein